MLANIRVHEDGQSRLLCELDLMKFSEDQIRQRMSERGFNDESFFICGFSDWEIDTILSLEEAYLLKKVILELYDGDDFVVRHLLERHKSVLEIMKSHYIFSTKDEKELMKRLMRGREMDLVIDFFYQVTNWVTFVQVYIDKGVVLNTSRGFYVDVDYVY